MRAIRVAGGVVGLLMAMAATAAESAPCVSGPKVLAWSKKQTLRNVPLGVFEDVDGPPSYRLARDADVTVLLAVKQKVVKNYAFRAGELTDARIADVLKNVPALVAAKK